MSFVRTSRFAASLALVLSAAACSSSDATGPSETQDAPLNESKALGMTDVTILYPLPKSIDFLDDMLGPPSELDRGELLPADAFAQLAQLPSPTMLTLSDGKPIDPKRPLFAEWLSSFSVLRVVGIRLDPCFGGNLSDPAAHDCTNTIRLTLQFFSQGPGNMAPDGRTAIHLFYEIPRGEFTELANAMLELRKTTGLPLQKGLIGTWRGVHPTLADQGLRGAYATALKNIILKYAGEQTLTRIAFCVQDRGTPLNGYYNNNTVADSRWVFGRYEYRGGTIYQSEISTLDYTGLQTVDSAPRTPGRDMVVVSPAPVIADNFLPFFDTKPDGNGHIDPAPVERARRASFNLLNPTKYNATNADCVSCHMAKQVQPNHGPDTNDYTSYTYRLDHTHDFFGPFRMFGYDGSGNPIVSTRVVNETAMVLDYLDKVVLK